MDPWCWSVDEVVSNLCHQHHLWEDRPQSTLPDGVTFERILRENEIDGSTLLQSVDLQTIKDDLGIRSLGQRSAVHHAIKKLQSISPKYLNSKASLASHLYSEPEQNPIHSLSPAPTPPNPDRFNRHLEIERSGSPRPERPCVDTDQGKHHGELQKEAHARAGEVLVESKDGGRKRRKLLLEAGPIEQRAKQKSKPVCPTFAFLGKSKMVLDDAFYGNIGYGEPISESRDLDEDDPTFLGRSAVPWGRQSIMNCILKYHFRAEPERLSADKIAFYPYSKHAVAPKKPRSVTMFRMEGNQITGRRWAESMINYEPMPEALTQIDVGENHEWDYLLTKYCQRSAEEDLLPLYNESGSEGDYEGSLVDELEEVEQDAKQAQQYMSAQQVFDIVDQSVRDLQRRWEAEKLPTKQRLAYRIWRKGQGRKRPANIQQAQRDIERLEARLLKYKNEIGGELWKRPPQVARQCAIMETTVYEKEEAAWKVGILRRTAPPAPQSFQTQPKHPKPKTDDGGNEEGESLDSDTDDMGAFLEDDDLDQATTAAALESDSLTRQENVATLHDQHTAPPPDGGQLLEPSSRRPSSPDSVLGPLASDEPLITPVTKRHSDASVIDLTMSSSPAPPASPLAAQPDSPSPTAPSPPARAFSSQPETSHLEEISAWTFDDLEERDDRKRLLLRLLHDLDPALYLEIKKRMAVVDENSCRSDVKKGVRAIADEGQRIPGINKKDLDQVFAMSRLFICWVACNHVYLDQYVVIPEGTRNEFLTTLNRNFTPFYNFLKQVTGPEGPFASWDSEDEDPNSPRKHRKVVRSKKARQLVENAQSRRDLGIQAERKLELQLQSSGLGKDKIGVIINPGKRDDEEFIYINEHVSERIKPHQTHGIRFLWRELVSSNAMQGGLLAHTMGLGKTMQTITFLVTIAEAAMSSNPKVRDQIPVELRDQRTLILCPASLIENWKEEFRTWRPSGKNVGHVYEVTAAELRPQRLARIRAWYQEGGILIIGFDLFRQLLTKVGSKNTQGDESEILQLRKQLLDGPNIVVADEAHKMKNRQSGLGILAPQFRTQSRIALTGSPLANNLTEYYAMIEWVAPGYLGDIAEFRAYYEKPIQDGNYLESSRTEKRRSLKKMEAFKADIDPKVSRADVSVLKDSLPPKTEFLIRIAMTELQFEAYSEFVRFLKHGENVEQTMLWDWMGLLGHLCVHPSLLVAKLDERQKGGPKKKKGRKARLPEPVGLDLERADETPEADVPDSLVAEQRKIFAGLEDLQSIKHSYKAMIIEKIVMHAVQAGDRILIFSQSLRTLDFLGRHLKTLPGKLRMTRLDGGTDMSDRMVMSKDFNRGEYDVFLISTRAGGLGINIPGANRVILADFGWNPTWEEQAIGRAYRLGQMKPCFVYQLVMGGTFEDVLYQKAVFKKQLAMRAVDKKNVTSVATKPQEFLFAPRRINPEDLGEFKGKDEVLDKILADPVSEAVYAMATEEILRAETDEKLTEEELREVREMQEDNKLRLTNHAEWKRRDDARMLEEQRRLSLPLTVPLKAPATPRSVQQEQAPGGLRLRLNSQTMPDKQESCSMSISPDPEDVRKEPMKGVDGLRPPPELAASPEPEDVRKPKEPSLGTQPALRPQIETKANQDDLGWETKRSPSKEL